MGRSEAQGRGIVKVGTAGAFAPIVFVGYQFASTTFAKNSVDAWDLHPQGCYNFHPQCYIPNDDPAWTTLQPAVKYPCLGGQVDPLPVSRLPPH